jgi:hypothetical protein
MEIKVKGVTCETLTKLENFLNSEANLTKNAKGQLTVSIIKISEIAAHIDYEQKDKDGLEISFNLHLDVPEQMLNENRVFYALNRKRINLLLDVLGLFPEE